MLLGITFLSCSSSHETQSASNSAYTGVNAHDFAELITEDFLREHLYIFAGDEFEGRGTGQEGIEKAAEYIKNFYIEHGVKPLGDNGSYFQHFHLNAYVTTAIEFELHSTDSDNSQVVNSSVFSTDSFGNEFTRIAGGGQTFSGDIVFAGYGVNDPNRGVNHFGEEDLTDKWVMVFSDIEHVVDGDTLIDTRLGGWQRTRDILFNRAAGGLILIREMDEEDYLEQSESFARLMGIPTGFALPGNPPRGRLSVPILTVSPSMAAAMIGLDESIEEYFSEFSKNPRDFEAFSLSHNLLSTSVTSQAEVPVRNVVGLVEGSDPELKNEYIVISAHYDHLGLSTPNADGDFIYNGADDNGSGSVNILAQARALMAAKEAGVGPKRSVILLHVTAEEVGLLGSRYYSDNPTVPIEQIIANINTDMIGRVDDDMAEAGIENYVYVIGAEIISSDLNNRMMEASEIRGHELELSMRFNDLDDRNQFYRRSDHWNFGRLRIPFIFFFSGVHADYHQPSDTPDRITYGPYAKRAQLIYSTTLQIANYPTPPVVDSQEFINRTQSNPR